MPGELTIRSRVKPSAKALEMGLFPTMGANWRGTIVEESDDKQTWLVMAAGGTTIRQAFAKWTLQAA